MNEGRTFERDFFKIALPVALQWIFQASFSVADQIMVGQLGGAAVAGIGLGGKFSSLYSVVLAAIATAAGIAIAQYLQNPDPRPAARSFYWSLLLTLALAGGFTALSVSSWPRMTPGSWAWWSTTTPSTRGAFWRMASWPPPSAPCPGRSTPPGTL